MMKSMTDKCASDRERGLLLEHMERASPVEFSHGLRLGS